MRIATFPSGRLSIGVRFTHLARINVSGRIKTSQRGSNQNQRKYAIAPCLAETFVERDRDRFAGICYRAANWRPVGQTCGRSNTTGIIPYRCPLKTALQGAQRAAYRQAAPFRGDPQKRTVAPKRPGRKRGHPGACRPEPKQINESLEVTLPISPVY